MVKGFVERGIPIDGIGFEMHLDADGIDYNSFAENMARFAALGLEIWITEMDVRISPMPTETDLENQANIYRQVVSRIMNEPACKVFQTWGITDSYSWIPTAFPGTDNYLLWDRDYNPKPAFYAVQEELSKPAATPRPTPIPPEVILEIVPSEITAESGPAFELRVSMTNTTSVAAYDIEIHFDPQYLRPDRSVYRGAYLPGEDWFVSTGFQMFEPPSNPLEIMGFDVMGSKIGTHLDMLHLFFIAGNISGQTEVTIHVNEFTDSAVSPLSVKTYPATIVLEKTPTCLLLGDGNGDGRVNIVDALLMAQVYVGLPGVEANGDCLDINCDGKVDIINALELAQKYVSTAPMVFNCP